ncbi:ROK family protein [Actinoplanes sp. NPDC049265]|uniref:ROK family protein n=1 Tax=Actinoplanes sp. NPDC049265 TaxID=3363902 RepID=UPI00371F3492
MTARIQAASTAPVRQSSVRAHNLALALQTVATSENPISRAFVAAATGLTRATVSALVDDLISGGLLVEGDPVTRTGAGRPAAGLTLAPDGAFGLGLEINVDYLAACVVDLTGAVRFRVVSPSDPRQLGSWATTLARLTRGIPSVAGAALAVPGLVSADGIVRVAPNLGWQDVDAASILGETLGMPVAVDNEANLAALSELRAAGGRPTFAYISGEIGIGAGLVLEGALYRGVRGWSGEIGHLPVHPDGRACRCGARGCLEQYAGQEAILRTAGVTTLADLPDRADLSEAGTALGIALAGVVNLLDLDTIVLGGIYGPLLPRLRPGIEQELRRRVLTASLAPIALRASVLGADAAMRGAAESVIRAILEDPASFLGGR